MRTRPPPTPLPPSERFRDRVDRHLARETGPNDVAKAVLIELETECRALLPASPEDARDLLLEAVTETLVLYARNRIDHKRNHTKSHVPPPPAPAPPSGKTHTRAHAGSASSRKLAARATWYSTWETEFFNESRRTPTGYKRIGDFTAEDWDAAAATHRTMIDANTTSLRQSREMAAAIRRRGVTLTRELPTGDTAEIMAPAYAPAHTRTPV
jgi:hypothetical protein